MEAQGSKLLLILAGLFGFAILFSRWLSQMATGPITRLSRVASATTNGVVITDRRGRAEWINEAFARFSGYSLDEMYGHKPGSVLQGTDTDPRTVNRIRQALRDKGRFDEELLNYTKHGEPYWVQISCSPLQSDQGRLSGYIAIETDVTERREFQQRLHEEHERLEQILWGTGAGTWELNALTDELHVNERWADLLGYSLSEVEPTTLAGWFNFIHEDDRERCQTALDEHLQGEIRAYECEARVQHRNGHWLWVMDRARVVRRDEDGQPLWVSGTRIDITERKQAQSRVQNLLDHLQKMMAMVPGAVYQYRHWPDGSTSFPYVSPGVRAVLDLDPETVTENAAVMFEHIHDEDRERIQGSFAESAVTLGTWHEQYRVHRADGAVIWVDNQAKPEKLHDGSVLWHGYLHDVTAAKQRQDRLEQVAHRDTLTGLANRLLLADRLEQAMASCGRRGTLMAVVYLDLDGFKPVNDAYGHDAGDALLQAVGQRLTDCLRSTDTAARIGGDEFVAVLTDLPSRHVAEQIVARLLERLSQPHHIGGAVLQVSASAGISFYSQSHETKRDDLIRQADSSMYDAKRVGKHRYRIFGEGQADH